jgi:ADP-L-glycero-D-manno-heptose 6-epimerase
MIAVTGAAGFIGSNLAHRLAALGRRDLVLVDHPLILAKTANLAGLPDCEFLEHAAFLEELQNGQRSVDAIFHLGACSDTTEQDWSYLLRNNLEYSKSLWRWCADNRKTFLYASSASTYGDGSLGFDDETPPDQLRPLNLYAKSKNDFDVWVLQQLADARPAPQGWAGLKFFNVYGPREGHKGRMASMVWHTYHQIRESGEVKLFRSTEPSIGDGGQRRDFVYVGDCVDHLLWLWKNPGVRGIFNSGTGQARSFLDLVSNTFRTLGREPKIRFIDMPEDLKNRYQSFTQARMGKLRSAGYPGFPTSLEQGIAQYVEWLKSPQPPAPLSVGSGQPWERTGEVATPRG